MKADHSQKHPCFELDAEHLRQEAQKTITWVTILLAWVAFVDAMRSSQHSLWPLLTCALLIAGVALGCAWREKHPRRVRLVLVGALAGAYFGLVATYPHSGSRCFGILVLIICSGMLSDVGYWTLTSVLCVGVILIEVCAPGVAAGKSELARTVTLLILSTVVSLLSRWHLSAALSWSSQSALRALQLLRQSRDRQLLLNRTFRAMEEAAYRLERMNNELLLAQSEAQMARAAKSRFAATVSHEIRGPLSLILGFSESMALSPERYGRNLTSAFYADVDTIYRNAQHLCTLVDDVLDLSRIETEHLPLVKDRIDLEEDVVKETIRNVRPLAERRGLYMLYERSGELSWILADPVRLRQALLNLLMNAIRFTQRGGITVRTSREHDSVLVRVEDTGSGIPPKEMPRIFREFQQLQVETRRGEGGSGLGLSITKHLIEAHGGKIWVESQVGVGTAISFRVPLPGKESLQYPLVRTKDAVHRTIQHRTCLVVHDDPTIVNSLARYIEGYRVIGLADESQIRRLTEELHPRAIVTNPELADRVRKELASTSFDVPIISCRMPRAKDQPHLEGILGYLVKPVKREALESFARQVDRNGQVTVLIVDDEPDFVRLMQHMLASTPLNCKTLRANDGHEALDLMKATRPDIVFLDWLMPRVSGEQTLAHMRADARLRDIPVVIVSGRDWIDGQATLGTPITVECKMPLGLARGASCLQALLDALRPDYLPDSVPRGPSVQGSLW